MARSDGGVLRKRITSSYDVIEMGVPMTGVFCG
jgi:hypothetical protein